MEKFNLSDIKFVHFTGIGGVSMSALAKFCLKKGFAVSGSDKKHSSFTEELIKLGAKIYRGHSAKNVKNADLLVYTSAISDKNAELVAAKQNGIPILKRSELLGAIIAKYAKSIAVAGCHGKTTTSAMITEILAAAGKDPTAFIGGEYPSFGNLKIGASEYVVAEACEYKKNLLDLKPYIAVILNIDDDHRDSFNGERDEIETFSQFMRNALAVVNADDEKSRGLFNASTVTFAIKSPADYVAKRLEEKSGCYSFDFYVHGMKRGRVRLKLRGVHYVYDALAALSVAENVGVPFATAKTSLEKFSGVKRRNEFIGEFSGLPCYADYAHHPTEIRALFDAYKNEDITAVFEPHTYSRTKYLLNEFVEALKIPSRVIICKTYAAREAYDDGGSAETLYRALDRERTEKGKTYYVGDENIEDILREAVKNRRSGKILFVGAGDIYYTALNLVKNNNKKI